MAQENFNVSLPNDGLGDALRDAFIKQQNMNTELYTTKVDKVTGKDLSTNDFTNALKAKLDSIEDFAQVNVQPNWLQTDNTADDYIKNKPTFNNVPDGLVQAGTATIDEVLDEITFSVGWIVQLGGNLAANFTPVTIAIPLATDSRFDIFVMNEVGNIIRVAGIDSVTPVIPSAPDGTILLTTVLVTDTTIGTPVTPDLVGFVQKVFFDYSKISLDVETLPADGRTNFTIDTALATFKGFNGSSELFRGKRFIIRNFSGADCELLAGQAVDLPFADTIVLGDGEMVELDVFNNELKRVGSEGGGVTVHNDLTGRDAVDAHPISAITGLQTVLDSKLDKEPDADSASASFLVSAKNYNFKEVELTVTGNITITIDQASNFNLIKLGSGTVTFVSGAGRTLIQMTEASEMLSEYSIARVFSIGTNDILYINDNNNLAFVKRDNQRYIVALAASFAVVGSTLQANVTITPAFADTNYDVKPNFVEQTAFYHLENKTASGFTLVIHQTTALTQNVPIGIQRYES